MKWNLLAGIATAETVFLPAVMRVTAVVVELLNPNDIQSWHPAHVEVRAEEGTHYRALTRATSVLNLHANSVVSVKSSLRSEVSLDIQASGTAHAVLFWGSADMLRDGKYVVTCGASEGVQALQRLSQRRLALGEKVSMLVSHNLVQTWFEWPWPSHEADLPAYGPPDLPPENLGGRLNPLSFGLEASSCCRDAVTRASGVDVTPWEHYGASVADPQWAELQQHVRRLEAMWREGQRTKERWHQLAVLMHVSIQPSLFGLDPSTTAKLLPRLCPG